MGRSSPLGGPGKETHMKGEKIDMVDYATRLCTGKGEVTKDEHAALREIKVVPYVMPSLDEMVEAKDKVSNLTILRTIRHNVEQWRDGARSMIGKNNTLDDEMYWAGRSNAYSKVLEFLDDMEKGLK